MFAVIIITCRVFYEGKHIQNKARILTYGFNRNGDIDGKYPGIHAEHDAINKLKPINRKKYLQNVNLLVIRLTKNNKLQQSKPCAICIRIMKTLPQKKGYKIKNIYYSNINGEIIKSNLTILENEELHYSKFYKQKMLI